jgi:hypothetical protein
VNPEKKKGQKENARIYIYIFLIMFRFAHPDWDAIFSFEIFSP